MITSKSLFRGSSVSIHALLMLLAASMIGVSIYLTNHYFAVKFPTGLAGSATLCDINSFFNCDTATNSPLSNIAGVPISVFGMLMGIFTFMGFVFKTDEMEGTIYQVLLLNLVGCVVLFLYSLIALGSLCPFCTLYYILSAAVFFIFFKYSNVRLIGPIPASSFAVVTLVVAGGFWFNISNKLERNDKVVASVISQFKALPNLGSLKEESPFRIASSSEKFEDAPIQITMFSDYQCPACKMLSEQAPKIAKKYQGKINIQYVFYPLDMDCNPSINRPMHPLACRAAYLTVCAGPEKFVKVHDDIFHNQASMDVDWINNYAKKEGVLDCLKKEETKKAVMDLIAQSNPFNVRSTPTMLINGVKIEGVLPLNQLYGILDDIVKNSK
ncbi:vitamin K epoxide reductase family protein [Halobacteriovorax sp. GB3]|uniref:vitamin K epoxide reductase/DsbA family protein n=1 Tax=Halobacteriovorax sp. GB3 TaxID=2719615 RepID=UPI00235E155A|nr:thioredoxin domain-containing protein [Halobacteriovorax sp. GB3]MDD0851471.1 vitamin K epoxide reductase family protein [Halobacteriovorax sp. GB3]